MATKIGEGSVFAHIAIVTSSVERNHYCHFINSSILYKLGMVRSTNYITNFYLYSTTQYQKDNKNKTQCSTSS